jgi:hypothetical protein
MSEETNIKKFTEDELKTIPADKISELIEQRNHSELTIIFKYNTNVTPEQIYRIIKADYYDRLHSLTEDVVLNPNFKEEYLIDILNHEYSPSEYIYNNILSKDFFNREYLDKLINGEIITIQAKARLVRYLYNSSKHNLMLTQHHIEYILKHSNWYDDEYTIAQLLTNVEDTKWLTVALNYKSDRWSNKRIHSHAARNSNITIEQLKRIFKEKKHWEARLEAIRHNKHKLTPELIEVILKDVSKHVILALLGVTSLTPDQLIKLTNNKKNIKDGEIRERILMNKGSNLSVFCALIERFDFTDSYSDAYIPHSFITKISNLNGLERAQLNLTAKGNEKLQSVLNKIYKQIEAYESRS